MKPAYDKISPVMGSNQLFRRVVQNNIKLTTPSVGFSLGRRPSPWSVVLPLLLAAGLFLWVTL